MEKQIFAVDIGNTHTHWAVFKSSKQTISGEILTSDLRKAPSLILNPFFRTPSFNARCGVNIGLVSVVPDLAKNLLPKLNIFCKKHNLFWFGKNADIPMKSFYEKGKVGIDRLSSSYAAWCMFQKSVITINLGTAITIDAVNNKGIYLGGVIMPGFEIMKKSLEEWTSGIGKVNFTKKIEPIGRSTVKCVSSGIFFSVLSGMSCVVSKQRKKIGKHSPVIISGGDAGLVPKGFLKNEKRIKNITLIGIFYSVKKLLEKARF